MCVFESRTAEQMQRLAGQLMKSPWVIYSFNLCKLELFQVKQRTEKNEASEALYVSQCLYIIINQQKKPTGSYVSD